MKRILWPKKLHLIIAVTTLTSVVCRANDGTESKDLKWATELGNNSTKVVWEHLQEQFRVQEMIEESAVSRLGLGEEQSTLRNLRPGQGQFGASRQFAGLYIFVSSSMPKTLLKGYINEAKKYGGVLVFKGLPNGSFKELIRLIGELTEEKNNQQEELPSMQIDDEAFDRFNVTLVPSIVLVEEGVYVPNKTPRIIYDKISGNVPIKYALEQFVDSGQLSKQAKEILHDTE